MEEDGCSERNSALGSDLVEFETANKGRSEDGGRVSVSTGADIKANTIGAAAHLSWEILVSLRTAASAEAPSSPMLLPWTLQSMGEVGVVRDEACQWALTRKRTLGAAAHLRLVILVLLRMAASAMAPSSSSPMLFESRL